MDWQHYLFDGECHENEVITQLTEGLVSRPYEKSERCDSSKGKGYLAPNKKFFDDGLCIKQECADELVKFEVGHRSGSAKNIEKLSEKCRDSPNNKVYFREILYTYNFKYFKFECITRRQPCTLQICRACSPILSNGQTNNYTWIHSRQRQSKE